MDNLEQNNEISLYDLWIKIWKNKILIAIITLSITLLGVLALYFVNRSSAYVSNTFNYRFIGSESGIYADGSVFDFKTMGDEEFLTKVKNRNLEKFGSLKINEILEDEKFSFDIVELMDKNEENIIDRYFKIDMPLKYFGYNNDLAKEFIKEIHSEVLETAKEKNESLNVVNYFTGNSNLGTEYNANLTGLTYAQIFYQIRNQYTLTINGFDNFIAKYGQATIEGVNVESLKANYVFWYNTTVNVAGLEEEVQKMNYIRNYDETIKNAKQRLMVIDRDLFINTNIINELTDKLDQVPMPGTILDIEVYNREIEKRTIENVYLEYEKQELENLVAETKQNIDEQFDKFVIDSAMNMSETVKYFNDFSLKYTNSLVRYERYKGPDYEVKKSFNMPLMSVVVLMVGGIIGVSAALIKESSSKNKELN